MTRNSNRSGLPSARVWGLAVIASLFVFSVGQLASGQAQKTVDLTVSLAAPGSAVANDPIVYTIFINNVTTEPATGVTVMDILPSGVGFTATGTSAGCSNNAGTVTCLVGNIAGNSFVKVTIAAKALTPGIATNVVGAIANEFEADITSNSVKYSTQIAAEALTLKTVSPITGATDGGTPLILGGTGFLDGASVTFGGVSPVIPGKVQSGGRSISVVAPRHCPGAVDIVVTNPNGQSATLANGYTYVGPCITGVSPNGGPPAGGTAVTIDGIGFDGNPTVTFGGTLAPRSAPPTATQIFVTSPTLPTGTVDVVVKNSDNKKFTAIGAFTYTTGPTIKTLDPNFGPAAGLISIRITGTGIVAGTQVFFDMQQATLIGIPTSTVITAKLPPHALGSVPVVLKNPDGSQSNSVMFSYVPPPTISAVSPTIGSTLGREKVTITGTGFFPNATATIGGLALTKGTLSGGTIVCPQTPAAGAVDVSADGTTITGCTQPHAAGPPPVDVKVTNRDGQNVTQPQSFSYVTCLHAPTNLAFDTGSLLFSWTAPDNLVAGDQVTYDLTLVGPLEDVPFPPNYFLHPTSSPFKVPFALRVGTYSWSLVARSATRCYSTYVAGPGFKIIASPTGLTPSGNTSLVETTTSATLSWTAVTGAVAYAVRAKDLTDPALQNFNNCNVAPQPPIYFCKDGITATSESLPVQAGHSYEWWVHAIDANGVWSPLANAFFSVIPAPPTGLSPNGTVFPFSTTSVTLSWSVGVGATLSAVRVQDNTDGTLRDSRNDCPINTVYVCKNDLTTTSYAVSVIAGHSYTWWVHAGNSAGKYSAQTNGTFSVLGPPTISAISPASGPTPGGTSVTITGTNFRGGATVSIGGVAATGVTVVNGTTITASTGAHACGTVDVVVTNADGSSGTKAGAYFYSSPASPTGLSPNGTIYPSSTTSVTLTWAATTGADRYAVRVQDNQDGTIRDARNNCASPTIYVCVDGITTTSFTVTVRAGHTYNWWAHAGNVCLQYSAQTNASFSVATALPAPTVTGISPAAGPMAGGTPVTITGTDFRSGATVSIGGVPATGVTLVSATTITATTPAHACGNVDVVVANTDGQSGTKAGAFFYTAPQPPTGLSPNGTAFPSSTTSVTLTWAVVSGATQYAVRVQDNEDGTIRDGRNNCASPTVYVCVDGVATTSFTVTVRAGHTYNWWVHAGSSCGQYSAQTNASFSVGFPAPTVTGIAPAAGPMAGGTPVTITGTGYRAGATVTIGGAAATGVTVVSATSITATTSAHACGTVNIVVTNPDGQSGTLTNGFFYTAPQPPTGLSPNGTTLPSSTTSVTLSWTTVSGATQYAVRVQDNQDGTIRDGRNNCASPTVYVCVDGVATTSFTVTVRAGHTYNWWVHAGSSCGQYSAQTNASFGVTAALPAPTVTGITPAAGPMAGGTPVTITGTGFQAGATVAIGGAAATGVTVVSATSITATTSAHTCGTVNIVVTNSDGQSGTLTNGFFYTAPQPPTGLSPNGTNLPSSATSVTLSWTAVSGATQYAVRVRDNTDGAIRDARNNCPTNTIYLCVDGVTTTTYSVSIQAGHSYDWWVHAGSACGQYSAQTNASFSVGFPAPTVATISPASGPLIGGTPVTITGTGFRSGAFVSIGGSAATGVAVVSATQINATTSSHLCGNADVVVTNSDGQSGTEFGAFYYDVPPPPTGLSPNATTLSSATTSVTLSWGATFGSSRYAVRVQDNTDGSIRDARNNCPTNTIYLCVDGVSGTTYSVAVQAGHSYTWWVHAGASCGQYSAQTTASFNVDFPPPTVSSISPANGPLIGGTSVTISGTGFRSGASVSLGGAGATGVSVLSSTQITAITQSHACGNADVTVTNPDGQSGTRFGAFYYDVPPPPTGLNPDGTTLPGTTTSVWLSWNATFGSSRYAVRVQDNTDGSIRDARNNCPTNTIYLCVDGVSGTTYNVPVQQGHSYTWWVHAGTACGQYGTQTYGSFTVAVEPLHAPTGLDKEASPSRNLVWNPPDNLTGADAVTYDLWITGGANCSSGCLYHPAAPSWYTMGAEIGPGTYSWSLKANSVSRPSSGAVSGPVFTMP